MKDKIIKLLNSIFAPRITINNAEIDAKDFPTRDLNKLFKEQEEMFDKFVNLMNKVVEIKRKSL